VPNLVPIWSILLNLQAVNSAWPRFEPPCILFFLKFWTLKSDDCQCYIAQKLICSIFMRHPIYSKEVQLSFWHSSRVWQTDRQAGRITVENIVPAQFLRSKSFSYRMPTNVTRCCSAYKTKNADLRGYSENSALHHMPKSYDRQLLYKLDRAIDAASVRALRHSSHIQRPTCSAADC